MTSTWRPSVGITPPGHAQPGSGISAVTRLDGALDVFWVGADGSIATAWANPGVDGGKWQPSFGITPPGHAQPGSGISAVTRLDGALDVFWVGADGSIATASCPPEALVFEENIISGGLAALGGWVRLTIFADGRARWEGEAESKGVDGYTFGIGALVKGSSGRSIGAARSGHVGGSIAPGETTYKWDETYPPRSEVAAHFTEFIGAEFDTNLDYSSDFGDAIEDVGKALDVAKKWIDRAAAAYKVITFFV